LVRSPGLEPSHGPRSRDARIEGAARVYSEALVEANKKRGSKARQSPEALFRFTRLVASPEPELLIARRDPQGSGECRSARVYKRAAGRGEWGQHHLGILICSSQLL